MFQNLFDSISDSSRDDDFSSVLSQIISIGVVHGEPMCRLAAAVNMLSCYPVRVACIGCLAVEMCEILSY